MQVYLELAKCTQNNLVLILKIVLAKDIQILFKDHIQKFLDLKMSNKKLYVIENKLTLENLFL